MAKQSKNLPAEVAETETELEVLDAGPPEPPEMQLANQIVTARAAMTPQERITENAELVAALAPEIQREHLANIQGKDYMCVGGGIAIANALGFTISVSGITRDQDLGVFEATAEMRNGLTNEVVATAVGYVGDDESRWVNGPKFALLSMTQTRAEAKLCRANFGHLYTIFGAASATPAEEMGGIRDNGPQSPAPRPRKQVASTAKTKAKVAEATPEPGPEPAKAKAKVTLPDSEILDPKIGAKGQDLMVIHSVTHLSSGEGDKAWKVYFAQARGSVTRFASGKKATIQAEVRYATFDEKIAEKLRQMEDTGIEIGIDWVQAKTKKGKGLRINKIMNADDVTANHGGSPDVVTKGDIDKTLDNDIPF